MYIGCLVAGMREYACKSAFALVLVFLRTRMIKMSSYNIAGYVMDLSGIPKSVIWNRFDEFACDASTPHISFRLISEPLKDFYNIPDDAEKLVDFPLYMTYRYGGSTHFFGAQHDIIAHTKVNNDYSECIFNIKPQYYSCFDDPETRESICDVVMMEMRKILTGRLALDQGICIHSCVINYDGYGVLFSAVSETGKSTHAHLWLEAFPETEIINGDNGFCRVLDGVPYVFSAPWCGDSNEYTNKSLPIKAIVFLERAEKNCIVKLDKLSAFMRMSARCYMPFWDKELVHKAMDTVEYLTNRVQCYHLMCLPDHDAVKVVAHELFR